MTPARAVPQPAGRLAAAGGLALVVAVALYIFGQTHTPSYTMGLFGQHGIAVNRLKAQLATGMLGLALVQLTLALWMYRRLPGAGAASRRRCELVPALVACCRALHVRLRRAAGRPAGGGALGGRLLLLRRVRGQGADRAEPSAAGLGAAARGRPARHPDRRHVVLERAVVLRRLPSAPAVTWSQARSGVPLALTPAVRIPAPRSQAGGRWWPPRPGRARRACPGCWRRAPWPSWG